MLCMCPYMPASYVSIRMEVGGGNTSECVHLNYPITSGWRRLLVIGSGIDYPHHTPRPHRSTGNWVHWVSVWCCGDDMQWSVMSAVEWHGINTHRVSGHLQVSSPLSSVLEPTPLRLRRNGNLDSHRSRYLWLVAQKLESCLLCSLQIHLTGLVLNFNGWVMCCPFFEPKFQ